MKITGKKLREILYEEFTSENWGDIDPLYFNPKLKKNEMGDMEGLDKVIDRVADRINKLNENK